MFGVIPHYNTISDKTKENNPGWEKPPSFLSRRE
jgi:hypothetical protein